MNITQVSPAHLWILHRWVLPTYKYYEGGPCPPMNITQMSPAHLWILHRWALPTYEYYTGESCPPVNITQVSPAHIWILHRWALPTYDSLREQSLVRVATSWIEPQNYRWQNRKEYKGKTNSAPGPPPPWLHSYIIWLLYRPGGTHRPPSLCVNLLSVKTFFIAAILLWENDDVGIVLFYSVIYNSVDRTQFLVSKRCESVTL